MESEEREAATGRSQNVVHILPQSMDSVPRFLTAPLERVEPIAGVVQLVVVTSDAEGAVALAEAVLPLTGLGGIELFPVTSARRAARLMQGRPILAVAGTAMDLADLIRASQLKLQDVRTLVLAWVDEVLEGDTEATSALELLMTEIPKEAARILVTERPDARLDAFIERYLRRARRVDEREAVDDAEPVAIQYVAVSPASGPAALRRLLDDLDPPSAAVLAGSDVEAESVSSLLRALGYASDGTVQVSRSEVVPNTHAVIFYGMPGSRKLLTTAVSANPVALIAVVQPRDLPALRRMAGGEVRPLTLPEAGKSARDRERILRRELAGVLDSGVPAREILALEPLLDRHDGIEIAAAALRLLERERAARKSADEAGRAAALKKEPPASSSYGRGARSDDGRRGAPERGGRPSEARRGPPGRGRDDRSRPHGRADRPSGPRPAGGRPPRDRS